MGHLRQIAAEVEGRTLIRELEWKKLRGQRVSSPHAAHPEVWFIEGFPSSSSRATIS